MTRDTAMIETDSATITLVSECCMEQRYFPEARFDTASMERNRNAREQLINGRSYGLLVIIPEGTEVQPSSTNTDHFRLESVERRILAMAVVTNGAAMHAVSKFYFRYYPQSFEVEVFEDEDAAREWLNHRMSTNGS